MVDKNEQRISALLNKYKKKQKMSLGEKMDIFMHVYKLPLEQKPNTLRQILNIVLDESGKSFTISEDFDKQTFLNIYGEPKNKIFSLNGLEDVLNIVLNELSIRDDIAPIFPTENAREALTPYSKENSMENLAMKKFNIYSSTSFELDRLINFKQHIDFPLTPSELEDLTWIDEFKKVIEPVFTLMKTAFKNSRQNYPKLFTQWFNGHFWKQNFGQIEFAEDKQLFNRVYEVFKKHAEVALTINTSHLNNSNSQEITILGGKELSSIGQQYLKTLSPFKLVQETKIVFQ